MADAATTNPLFEMWRRQFEESAAAWARMVTQTQTPPPTDPTAFWRPVLNQGLEQWARLFAQTPVTPDLAAQWKQFLDQWLVAAAPMKKSAEQQIEQALATLNVASRTQLTAVAKQIVELEERLERMEDTLGAILKRLDGKERT